MLRLFRPKGLLNSVYNHFIEHGTAYVVFILLMGKSGKAASNSIPQTPELTLQNHEPLANHILSTCTSEHFPATNRISGTSYMIVDGKYKSEICYMDELLGQQPSAECIASEYQDPSEYLNDKKRLDQLRLEANPSKNSILAATIADLTARKKHALSLINNPSEDQVRKIKAYNYIIFLLNDAKMFHDLSLKFNVGNCGEHSAHAAYNILSNAIKYDLDIKIQFLHVTTKNDSHRFVLIDSNLEDTILTDQIKISAFIKSFKKASGFICDTWNNGTFSEINKNKNNLYFQKGTKIELITLSLNLNENTLPQVYADFYNDELNRLGLKNMYGKKRFSFYAPVAPVNSNNEEIQKDSKLDL